MTTTRPPSFAPSIHRHADLPPLAVIGESALGHALGAALTSAGIPVEAGREIDELTSLGAARLIIEASDAALPLRVGALHRIEHAIGGAMPIATVLFRHTLSSLTRGLHEPERVVGLGALDKGEPISFLEIVRADASADTAVAAVRAIFDSTGIRTITVLDSPARYASRVAHSYVNEGLALLGEGVPAVTIEQAARAAGMSMGPLALLDALSLDEADRLLHSDSPGHEHDDAHEHDHEHGHEHSHEHEHEAAHDRHQHSADRGPEHARAHADEHAHSEEHTHHHAHAREHDPAGSASVRPHRMTTEAIYVLEKMAHGFKRMGTHSGRGFYEYDADEDEAPGLWPGLKVFERRRVVIVPDDLRDRLLYVQALESLRCLEEAVVASPADADLASVLGWGFPESAGGTIAFVEGTGLGAFLERTRDLAQRYGERFDPPPLLVRHAGSGEPFAEASQ